MNWPLMLLVALVILAPFLTLLLLRIHQWMKGHRAADLKHFETWRSDHFDQKGHCRTHPWYDGESDPDDPDCEACAVIHVAPSAGEGQ